MPAVVSLCGSFGGRCCSSARPPCWSCEILWECPVVLCVLVVVCDVFLQTLSWCCRSGSLPVGGGGRECSRTGCSLEATNVSPSHHMFPNVVATRCVFGLLQLPRARRLGTDPAERVRDTGPCPSASPPCPEEVQQTVGILRPLPCDPQKAAVSRGGTVSALQSVPSCLRSGERGKK